MDIPLPQETTSEFLKQHRKELRLEPEIEELVYALNDTEAVTTTYSCQGHFNLTDKPAFCHHNQKAQVHLRVKDLSKAAALLDEVLRVTNVERIDVAVVQFQNKIPTEPLLVEWLLEFRPREFWEMRPQDQGMQIVVAEGWTETRVRTLLRRAFAKAVRVCRRGGWQDPDSPYQHPTFTHQFAPVQEGCVIMNRPSEPHLIHENAVYTYESATKLLGLKATTLRRQIRRGELAVCRRCKVTYIMGWQLLAWLKGGQVRAKLTPVQDPPAEGPQLT